MPGYKAWFVRTTYKEEGKTPVVTEWKLVGGIYELDRILGPKHRGHFKEELVQHKRAVIEYPKKMVLWELFEKEIPM